MKMHHIFVALAASALITAPASARHWGNVDGWFVTSGEQSCGMYMQTDGPQSAEFLILKRLDGRVYVQVKNPAWNIAKGSEGDFRYQVDGRTYNGLQTAAALAESPGKGLLIAVGPDFESDIRSGSALAIVNGVLLLDQLSLKGSAAALAVVDSCLQDLRVNGDSFAKSAALAASKLPVVPASPKGNAGQWVTISDYPRSALRDGREGTVSFQLTVGKDGKVAGCSVTQSSGHQDIDDATCASLSKRARFSPAKDKSGKAMQGSYASRVSWKIPK